MPRPFPSITRFAYVWILLAVLTAAVPGRAQVSPGDTREDVIKVLGWPKSTSRTDDREILNYAECTVLMKDGRVEKLVFKTPEKRLKLWSQLNDAKNAAPPPAANPPPMVPAEPVPQYRPPVPEPLPRSPVPTRALRDPQTASGIDFATIGKVIIILLLIALGMGMFVLRNRTDWDKLHQELRRKGPRQPAPSAPPVLDPKPASKRKPDPLLDGWSLALLNEIEWHRFEQVVEAYEKLLGNQASLTGFGADGGIDVKVRDKATGQVIRITQCKAFGSQRVDVKLVREFFGVMIHEKVTQGAFYTTSSFTTEAVTFAEGKGLELVDGSAFLAKIKQLDLTSQLKLFELAIYGDYTTPTCASCGVKMVLKAEHNFWGCRNYPRCHSKIYVARASRT